MIAVLAGGVGAARLLRGLIDAVDPTTITAIVNTADDLVLHGLTICPDIDTIRYTLSDDIGEHGWGRADETWTAMDTLAHLSRCAPEGSRASDWFKLGDRDLAVHLYRTQRLAEGASLVEVTDELRRSAGLQIEMIPVTNDPIATMLTLDTSETIDFQEYFVGRRHQVSVRAVHVDGVDKATPAPQAMDALRNARRVVIAPSNPIISIGPVLAVAGIADVVRERRDDAVAVSPIVNGRALKGPADRLLDELGHDVSALGVARLWCDYAKTIVIDESDRSLAGDIERLGMDCVVAPTIMSDRQAAIDLARTVVEGRQSP